MATIGGTFYDLIDLYKSKDPDGTIADVVELLHQLTPMLKDAYAVECNNGTSHRHTIRTGLPSVAWGMLYKGITQSKSTKAQVTDTTGFVEGMTTVDCRLLDISENRGAVRMQEAESFLESIAQEVESTLFYGNSNSAPNEFMGLAPRFNDVTAPNGNQIIKAGGAGADNSSIWFVTWGPGTCHTLYPKGTMAGVKREDMGKQRVLDADGNPYYVEEEMFTQHIGMAVKDWRYISRICNIDISDLEAGTVDLYSFMRKAFYALQSRRHKYAQGKAGFTMGGQTVIYCNSDILEALDALATNAGSTDNFTRLRPMEIQGEEVLAYRGIPIRETDALLNTEALVA